MNTLKPMRTLLAVAAATMLLAIPALAQGKVEVVGGETFDWGKVAPGELTTTIEVRNTGDSVLKISKVQPGCGCTAAPIDKDVLQPGESGKISVKLDARSRSGQLHKIITVYSDDPSAPAKVINLKADIKQSLEFRPAQWFLVNDSRVGAETSSSVRIVNSGDQAFTVYPPELTSGNLRARFNMKEKQELQPGQELEITAMVTPLAGGAMNGTIRLKTSDKDHASIDLPVYGNVAETVVTPVPVPATPDISAKPGSGSK